MPSEQLHHPTPFLCLADCKRQPGQILGKQLATLRGNQAITEERKSRPKGRAGQYGGAGRTQSCRDLILGRGLKAQARGEPETQPLPRGANKGPYSTDTAFRIMYIMFKASPGGAGVPFASITLPCQAKKPASPACPSRPGSYGFLHRPIRVLYMTQAIQPQTKPTPATMISSSSKAAPFTP